MTALFCLKAIFAYFCMSLAIFVICKIALYPFIVLYRWASHSDDIFYLHDRDNSEKD